jgi:hypothetical protein
MTRANPHIPAFEKYPIEIAACGGRRGFVVTFPDLPGCVADGAINKMRQSLKL